MATQSQRILGSNPVGLISKPVVKKKKYKPASVIPGIAHFIEGQPSLSSVTRTSPNTQLASSWRSEQAQSSGIPGMRPGSTREDKGVKRAFTAFQQKQEARKRIQPIADPLAGASERRKKAARRRMRGRLGTLLSERETLA